MPNFPGELEDLETVRRIGLKWGYGRCIQYIQHAWAKKLRDEEGLDPKTAATGAFMGLHDAINWANGFSVLKEDQ